MSNYKSYFLKSMGLREDSLPGGKGDNTDPAQVDQEQLAMGIKVEMEHTQDEALAKEIALDHLTEDPNYYSTLKGAGLADELPGSSNGETLPMPPQMSRLFSPTAIMPTPVIATAVRGTRSGGLPAGGHVADPEKCRLGGLEAMKVLPQGGVQGDPEKARLGGWERVKNLKPNSQGAISDTPASDAIKAKGGHFTPDNGEITRGEAPKTNKKGSDAIHPMQVQQLGNEPIDDDGTTRDGKETPAAAEAGIEGGSAPSSESEEHPMSSQLTGHEQDEPNPPGDNFAPKEKEEPKGPWGIGLGDEDEDEDEEKEEGEADGVSIDIKEVRDAAQATVVKEGWAMGEYTPEQQKAVDLLMKKGFREVSTFPDQPDAENQGTTPQVIVVLQKKKSAFGTTQCEVDPQGLCNGLPVQQFLESWGLHECDDCGCGDPTMIHRFQQLANIKGKDAKMGEAGAISELKELVGRLNAKGKVTPLLAKAQKYLKEMDSPEEAGAGKLDAFIINAIEYRDRLADQNEVAETIVTKLEDMGVKNIKHRYDYILSLVTKYWK